MSEELEALDREWMRVARLHGQTPPYSSVARACFGHNGPWEWLIARFMDSYFVTLEAENVDSYSCHVTTYRTEDQVWTGEGRTPFEAITRCAIEARKRLEAKDE